MSIADAIINTHVKDGRVEDVAVLRKAITEAITLTMIYESASWFNGYSGIELADAWLKQHGVVKEE
jgi:hypothetical protein